MAVGRIVFLVLVLLIFLAPNLAFLPLVVGTKAEARLQLGTLVGRYGRMARERWVLGREVEEPGMLGAPELGPAGDVIVLFEPVQPVQGMHPVPIGLPTLAAVLVPAGIPMLGVLALDPIKELLGAVAKALM